LSIVHVYKLYLGLFTYLLSVSWTTSFYTIMGPIAQGATHVSSKRLSRWQHGFNTSMYSHSPGGSSGPRVESVVQQICTSSCTMCCWLMLSGGWTSIRSWQLATSTLRASWNSSRLLASAGQSAVDCEFVAATYTDLHCG